MSWLTAFHVMLPWAVPADPEELRIVFVALTRAQRYCALALPSPTAHKVINRFVGAGPRLPNRVAPPYVGSHGSAAHGRRGFVEIMPQSGLKQRSEPVVKGR